jgi:hypothetical protein
LNAARLATAALALTLLQTPSGSGGAPGAQGNGPFDIPLFATKAAPAARGHARLVYARSPFGVAVTADGRARYDVQITVSGLAAGTAAAAYVAWAVTPDLAEWHRLGAITNGRVTLGEIALNKFLLVITAEQSAQPATHAGPVVMRGYSPSIWLQTFLTHPMFRGVY